MDASSFLDPERCDVCSRDVCPICKSLAAIEAGEESEVDVLAAGMPWREAMDVVRVVSFGALKHTPNGWQDESAEFHLAAAHRHLNAHSTTGATDADSGLPHLAHAVTRLLFAMWCDRKAAG